MTEVIVLPPHRKSKMASMANLHPHTTSPPSSSSGTRKLNRMQTAVRFVSVVAAQPAPTTSPTLPPPAQDRTTTPTTGQPLDLTAPRVAAHMRLKGVAHSVIYDRHLQQSAALTEEDEEQRRQGPNGTDALPVLTKRRDQWSTVLSKVTPKVTTDSQEPAAVGSTPAGKIKRGVSLAHMLKSRKVKNLVKQAMVAKRWNRLSPADTAAGSGAKTNGQHSTVMEDWIKTAVVRNQTQELEDTRGDDSDDTDDDEIPGVESGFDLRGTKNRQLYGRTLLLEESCRRAFAQSSENRSHTDLQALKAWFQMTKLKITTDFERLQPTELDLLCRRMTLVSYHPSEIVFRQGDDGDALYLVFAGIVEVSVSQRILGEKVEVTVCELSKGDYFGERSLLNNDVRAATVVAKTTTELVKILRADYNMMLKKDQLEFLSRMQITNGIFAHKSSGHQPLREVVKVLVKKKSSRTKQDVHMLTEYLQTLKFFRALPKSFVRELCTVVDFQTLPAGAFVFKEGEVGDLFYIIFSGSVDVIVGSKDFRGNAQQTKLINLTEGSHFGELALMKGHGIRSATVCTREECKFLVICERDYNSTLRRMQKEDLSKRVGVLDKIPMFQTPEWTSELLKEMSYVLSEQKLPMGSVLFKQGEKALHVYFIVRGELSVTKDIADPVTQETHVVFVERIGRYRVIGDDAAAGATFNEAIYREVTVTATTPVEVLLLSKYDVFHRLSRAARETLRASAHLHAQSIVYLDSFHKAHKWETYKKKILQEHVNGDRIAKLIPQTSRCTQRLKMEDQPQPLKEKLSAQTATEDGVESSADSQLPSTSSSRISVALVKTNEFLLLQPEDKAMKKCFSQYKTIGHYVTSFNADAAPSEARKKQLVDVLQEMECCNGEILNEGNPLVYLDQQMLQNHTQNHQMEVRERAASRHRVSQVGAAAAAAIESSPTSAARRLSTPRVPDSEKRHDMHQFLQENFIFSRPLPTSPRHNQKSKKSKTSTETKGSISHRDSRRLSLNLEDALAKHGRRTTGHNATDSRSVLLSVRRREVEHEVYAPSFYIERTVSSLQEAEETVRKMVKLNEADRSDSEEPATKSATTYYLLSQNKLAVLPRPTLTPLAEKLIQKHTFEKWGMIGTVSPFPPSDTTPSRANNRASGGLEPGSDFSSPTNPSSNLMSTLFTSFQQIPLTSLDTKTDEKKENASKRNNCYKSPSKPAQSLHPREFAVISVALSHREIANSTCEEPFLCVHELFSSEAHAMKCALSLVPPLKNALLCVVPTQQWLKLEDAYEWCVQVEPDRRVTLQDSTDKRGSTSSAALQHQPISPNRTKSTTSFPLPAASRLEWQIDHDKAQRLHQFICARMGHKVLSVQEKERMWEDSNGFTIKSTVSLENKLTTLHEYLSVASPTIATRGQSNSRGGSGLLGKIRQVKRFGSIMKGRISCASTTPAAPMTSIS